MGLEYRGQRALTAVCDEAGRKAVRLLHSRCLAHAQLEIRIVPRTDHGLRGKHVYPFHWLREDFRGILRPAKHERIRACAVSQEVRFGSEAVVLDHRTQRVTHACQDVPSAHLGPGLRYRDEVRQPGAGVYCHHVRGHPVFKGFCEIVVIASDKLLYAPVHRAAFVGEEVGVLFNVVYIV